MTRSALDDIPGLGPTRQKRLLAHFGSLKRIRAATVDDIVAVPGIGPAVAAQIARALEATSTAPGVDASTGEIREDDEHPHVGGSHPSERTAR